MKFKKGQSGNPKGRKRGSQNHVTRAVKEAILEALNDDDGAVAFFRKLKNGSAEDRRTFANLCGRMIPHELTSAGDTERPEMSLIEMARTIAFMLACADKKLSSSAGERKTEPSG